MDDYVAIAGHFSWTLTEMRQLPRRMRMHWAEVSARLSGLTRVTVTKGQQQ